MYAIDGKTGVDVEQLAQCMANDMKDGCTTTYAAIEKLKAVEGADYARWVMEQALSVIGFNEFVSEIVEVE